MPKQKRVAYDNAFKITVIEYAEKNSNCAAERHFKVREKLVRDWRKVKDKILKGPKEQKRKVIRSSRHNELESDLLACLMDLRKSGTTITRNIIRMKARELAKDANYSTGLFKASRGWCDSFKKKHGLYLRQRSHSTEVSGVLQEVNQSIDTEFDHELMETNNKEMEHDVCDRTYDSTFNDADEELDIFVEETELDLTENVDKNTVNSERGGVESVQDVVSKPRNTGNHVIKSPRSLAVVESSKGQDTEVTNQVLTKSGKADGVFANNSNLEPTAKEMEQPTCINKVADTSNDSQTVTSGKETVPDIVTNTVSVPNKHSHSDSMASSLNQSKHRKSVSPIDAMQDAKIHQEYLDGTVDGRDGSGNMDGVYRYITMLVSSEQDDAVRLLFRNKNWRCWLKELSDENVTDLIEGGFGSILPSPEREEGLETNVCTEIKSPVGYSDEFSDSQSLTDNRNTVRNESMGEEHDEQIDDMTKPSFITVKTKLNDIDGDIEDIDSSINGQYREDMKGHNGEDIDDMGKFKEDSDSSVNMESFCNKKDGEKDDNDDEPMEDKILNAVKDMASGLTDENDDTMDYAIAEEQHGPCLKDIQTESTEQNEGPGFGDILKTENYEEDENQLSDGSSNGLTQDKMSGAVGEHPSNDNSAENLNNKFKCTVCAISCMTNILLKKHFEHHHCGLWLDFYCKDCFERFETREDLWKHRKTVQHPPSKNIASRTLNTPEELIAMGHIKCEICDKFYSHRRSMRKHMFEEHKDAVEKYQCGVCEEKFDKCGQLWQHMRETKHSTSVSQLGNYQCELCGRITTNYDSFKRHKLSCSKDKVTKEALKTTPCDICGTLFSTRVEVNLHKRRVHAVSPMACDICGYMCKNKFTLRVHKFRHDPKNRKFPCDMCSKSFFNNALLTQHKRTHTKEKPFKCPICSYRCALQQNMHKHARNVHKTKLNKIMSDMPLP